MLKPLKLIIAGSRFYENENDAFIHLDALNYKLYQQGYKISEVFCGMADGADMLGSKWAKSNGIPVIPFPANWKKDGLKSGPLRNKDMADGADYLIAFWDGRIKGTYNMIEQMRKQHKPYQVIRVDIH